MLQRLPGTRTALLLIVSVMSLPVVAGTPAAHAAVSPKAFTLSLGDVTHVLGSHWRTSYARVVSNAQMGSASFPGLTTSSRVMADRVTGYMAAYTRSGAMVYKGGKFVTLPGPGSVTSYINVYKNDAGPRQMMTLARHYAPKKMAGVTYAIAPMSGVGDEALLETLTLKLSPQFPTTRGVAIIFRRGRYVGLVSVSWYGKPSVSDTVQLANIMDGRIRAAG